MSDFFNSKRHVAIIALTVISAIVLGCTSAFMITAAPEDTVLPALAVNNAASRITSPFAGDSTSLSEREAVKYFPEASTDISISPEDFITYQTDDEDEYTTVTAASFAAAAPEIELDYTEVTEAVAETTEDTVETTPQTEDVEQAETEVATPSETEEGEVEPEVVLPDLPEGFLADQLGVSYSIKKTMYPVTDLEIKYVATIVQLEVMGSGSRLYSFEDIPEKYMEMLCVAQCIRNRMESKRFPNSATDVIFQCGKNGSGKFVYQFYAEDVLSQYEPTYEAYIAAYEVLVSGVTVVPNNYYYFCATRICDYFESTNYSALTRKDDGSFDKFTGHLTTFYGGH